MSLSPSFPGRAGLGSRGLRVRRALRALRVLRALRDETGAVTAEYAIVIMGAVGFASALVAILRSEQVKQMLLGLVKNALGAA